MERNRWGLCATRKRLLRWNIKKLRKETKLSTLCRKTQLGFLLFLIPIDIFKNNCQARKGILKTYSESVEQKRFSICRCEYPLSTVIMVVSQQGIWGNAVQEENHKPFEFSESWRSGVHAVTKTWVINRLNILPGQWELGFLHPLVDVMWNPGGKPLWLFVSVWQQTGEREKEKEEKEWEWEWKWERVRESQGEEDKIA